MKSYKLDKKYFKSGKKDVVTLAGNNTFAVDANSNLSQKVLEKLYNFDKPYILCDCDEPCERKKSKVAKIKKVKIDESKSAKEEIQEEVSEGSEEE